MTADDFGLSEKTNKAIIKAYRGGVLTAASLMVGGSAVAEAVDLANTHPGLAVGLHLSFSDTLPCSPPEQVSLLIDETGRFPCNERMLDRAFLTQKGRTQIQLEITNQFAAYQRTGLRLDHVNVHRHAHLRPMLALMVFQEAARWGTTMVRVPREPSKSIRDFIRLIRASALRRLASSYRLQSPDYAIGSAWTADYLVFVLQNLKPGINELYFHPIIEEPGHQFANDLPAMLDPRVKKLVNGFLLRSYHNLN